MYKSEVKKLKPGQWVLFGDANPHTYWRRGQVLHVTPRGGVKVKTSSGDTWLPYIFVHQQIDPDSPSFADYADTDRPRVWGG